MSKIFVSYRREDSAGTTGRLCDRLTERFGPGSVFKDVEAIEIGADFRAALQQAVQESLVVLVMIGKRWLDITDNQGNRRLDSDADFVRIEVEAALSRKVPVVPVLVDNATMPSVRDLPATMSEFAYRHSTEVRPDPHFNPDVQQFIEQLAALLAKLEGASSAPVAPETTTPSVVAPAAPAISAPVISLPPNRFPERFAELGFTAHRIDNKEFILPPVCDVPAGEFLMGSDPASDPAARDNEKPQHAVTLRGFRMAQHPVTVAEYAYFVRAGHAEPKVVLAQDGFSNWLSKLGFADEVKVIWQTQLQRLGHPVVCVSWPDAYAYAAWLSSLTQQNWRLPTEAEWEKAARWDPISRRSRIYPWGDVFDAARANTTEGNKRTTTPVGAYPDGASPYGLHDMTGNVWEITTSLEKSYPYHVADGRELQTTPGARVIHGGCWASEAAFSRPAYRGGQEPWSALGARGFRLILDDYPS